MGNGGSPEMALIESLTNDLCEVADLAAQFADPENVEAARAAVARWSPTRMVQALTGELLAAG